MHVEIPQTIYAFQLTHFWEGNFSQLSFIRYIDVSGRKYVNIFYRNGVKSFLNEPLLFRIFTVFSQGIYQTFSKWYLVTKFKKYPVQSKVEKCRSIKYKYCTRAIITHSWFETALDYKPQILDPKIEEFPCLVHKLFVTLTALQYRPQWKMG